MIELLVKDYCHTCGDFEAETETLYYDNQNVCTMIKCSYATKCERILEHLKQEIGGENGLCAKIKT